MTAPPARLLTDSVLAKAATSGVTIGDAEAPAGAAPPYAVIYPLGMFGAQPTLRDVNATPSLEWQVTAVGDTREQAQWVIDQVRAVMLDGTLPGAAGTHHFIGEPTLVPVQQVERDDDATPPVFYAVDIYRFMVTPS